MEKISKDNIKCSECGSTNTMKCNAILNTSIILLMFGLVGNFICFIIPIFWVALPMTILATLLGVIMLISSIFIKDYVLTCKDCKSKFKLTKEEYKSK